MAAYISNQPLDLDLAKQKLLVWWIFSRLDIKYFLLMFGEHILFVSGAKFHCDKLLLKFEYNLSPCVKHKLVSLENSDDTDLKVNTWPNDKMVMFQTSHIFSLM